jgi:hypothetical protein
MILGSRSSAYEQENTFVSEIIESTKIGGCLSRSFKYAKDFGMLGCYFWEIKPTSSCQIDASS